MTTRRDILSLTGLSAVVAMLRPSKAEAASVPMQYLPIGGTAASLSSDWLAEADTIAKMIEQDEEGGFGKRLITHPTVSYGTSPVDYVSLVTLEQFKDVRIPLIYATIVDRIGRYDEYLDAVCNYVSDRWMQRHGLTQFLTTDPIVIPEGYPTAGETVPLTQTETRKHCLYIPETSQGDLATVLAYKLSSLFMLRLFRLARARRQLRQTSGDVSVTVKMQLKPLSIFTERHMYARDIRSAEISQCIVLACQPGDIPWVADLSHIHPTL